jgi:hypothetical protein
MSDTCTVNVLMCIIEDSRSIIEDSRSISDTSRVIRMMIQGILIEGEGSVRLTSL